MLLAGLSAAFAAAFALALLPVQVEAVGCPQREQVEQALAALLPPAPDGTRPDRARIWMQDGQLQVELVNPDGAVIAERSLEARGSCADQAAMLAVVIASWESDVHPAFAATPAEVVAAPTPAPKAPTPTPPSAASFDLALGAGPSFASSFAAAASAHVTWIFRGDGLGLRCSGTVDGRRSIDLGPRQATWDRWVGSLEGDWRWVRGRASVDVHGGGALGLLSVEGTNFDLNESATSFAPGLVVGTRLAFWGTRHGAVWLDVQTMLWLRQQSAYSQAGSREIPIFQGFAQVGLALGRNVRQP